MISVYPDILQALGIGYTFITAGNIRSFCFLYKISCGHWYIRPEQELPLNAPITLHIKRHGVYLEQPVTAVSCSNGYYDIVFTDKTLLATLFCDIAQLEADIGSWDRRKEQRYDVSVKNREAFSLRSNEQTLSFANKNITCLLDNVSFSGCRVITNGVTLIPPASQAALSLSFSNPIERIALPASIVHSHTRTVGSKRFSFISMQFIHPVGLSFKKRLASYIQMHTQQ